MSTLNRHMCDIPFYLAFFGFHSNSWVFVGMRHCQEQLRDTVALLRLYAMQSLGKGQDCDSWETQKRHGDIVNECFGDLDHNYNPFTKAWFLQFSFCSVVCQAITTCNICCSTANILWCWSVLFVRWEKNHAMFVYILLGVVFSTLKSDMEVGPGYCACVWTWYAGFNNIL